MVLVAAALAQESRVFAKRPIAGAPVLELRGGLQGGLGVAPTVCGELGTKWIGVEACGGGLFAPVGELVHFRVEGNVPVLDRGRWTATVQPGVGILEVEAGEDRPGFRFGAAQPGQREGAGVEASAAVKARYWASGRVYVSGEISAGAGWVPSAPVVIGQGGAVVPFALTTVGLGF